MLNFVFQERNPCFPSGAITLSKIYTACLACRPKRTLAFQNYIFNQQTVYEYVLAVKDAMTDAFKDISKFVIAHGPGIGQYCCEQRVEQKEVWFLLCSNVVALSWSDLNSLRISNYCF